MRGLKVLFFVLCLLYVQAVLARNETRIVTNDQYDELKRNNLLTGHEKIAILNPPEQLRVSPTIPQPASTGCDYWIPRDATWNIVPFTNGTPPQYRNDDGSSPLITLPFYFCFYGVLTNQVYINNNGNITLNREVSAYSAGGFPAGADTIMVAPFWADVDTRGAASGLVYYKITSSHMIVQWDRVGYFNSHTDKKCSFQLIISDGNDPIIRQGKNVSFCYLDMQWTTGDASQGVTGFGGVPATAGINAGNGIDYIQFGRYDHPGNDYDGPYVTTDGIDFLDNTYFSLDACFTNPNIPPLVNSLSGCDTIQICALDTFILSANYLSPEPTQITTASFLANGLAGTTVLTNTSGSTATIAIQIVPQIADVGFHTVYLSAIDNGSPPEALAVTVVVQVLPASSASFSSPPNACLADQVVLNYNGTALPSATYTWDFGGGNVLSGSGSGPYVVQYNSPGNHHVLLSVSDNGSCTDSAESIIQVNPVPVITVLNEDLQCNSDNSGEAYVNIIVGTPPLTIEWNTTPIQYGDTAYNLAAGSYIATVSAPGGCSTQKSVTVSEPAQLQMNAQFVNDSCGTSDGYAKVDVIGGTRPYRYAWNGGTPQFNSAIYNAPAGNYSVVVTDGHGCTKVGGGQITAGPKAEAGFDFSPYPVNYIDPKCVFQDQSVNAVQWRWDFGDGEKSAEPNPVHYFKKDGKLMVTQTVYNIYGCTDIYQREVPVEGQYTFYLPSSFTPDNDGKNDVFVPYTYGVESSNYRMEIFDRWGQSIFSSNDILLGWDGRSAVSNSHVPTGSYVYRFEFVDFKKETHELFGTIMVLK